MGDTVTQYVYLVPIHLDKLAIGEVCTMPRNKRNTNRRLPNRRRQGRNRRSTLNRLNVTRQTTIEGGQTTALALRQQRDIIRIPKIQFMSESILVDLVCNDTTLVLRNGTASLASIRWSMNSIKTPRVGGSQVCVGYTAWAAFFDLYRVLKFAYSIDLANTESFPLEAVACPSLTDLGDNYSQVGELFANPLASQSLLSAKTGDDRARLKGMIDLGSYAGNSHEYLSALEYQGVVGADPNIQYYMNLGIAGASALTSGNGCIFRATLTYTVLWTGRVVQTN